jgi:site-specific DNA recombinase
METNPKRVGIWIRVSTDMQVESESPEHHEQHARYYVKNKAGWEVAEVYRLDGMSGKSVWEYPETKRMLADIRSGHISALVFSKLARLARNTKELLEFAEIFRTCKADLISLAENIDTSTPAGRMFYTMIAAMAEWEREEIASRVAASVPIRARMGKPLGGQASFGYRWVEKELVLDEKEAPIRALMYELFLKHQRRKRVATELNKMGYRSRNLSQFTATTIDRLLRDSAAKGERVANYTKSLGEGKSWEMKPKEEWVIMPCPAVVSADLWNKVNNILDAQQGLRKPIGPKAVYLLSGFVKCECGKIMYVYQNSKTFACKDCKNRVLVSDLDEIYQEYLKDYLGSISHATYVDSLNAQMNDQKRLLDATKLERKKLSRDADVWLEMRVNKELSPEAFAEKYRPLETRIAQLDASIPQLEAEIDVSAIQLMSSDVVITEVKTLYHEWERKSFDEKRGIVESITGAVVVGREEIEIMMRYAPPVTTIPQNSTRNVRGSLKQPT